MKRVDGRSKALPRAMVRSHSATTKPNGELIPPPLESEFKALNVQRAFLSVKTNVGSAPPSRRPQGDVSATTMKLPRTALHIRRAAKRDLQIRTGESGNVAPTAAPVTPLSFPDSASSADPQRALTADARPDTDWRRVKTRVKSAGRLRDAQRKSSSLPSDDAGGKHSEPYPTANNRSPTTMDERELLSLYEADCKAALERESEQPNICRLNPLQRRLKRKSDGTAFFFPGISSSDPSTCPVEPSEDFRFGLPDEDIASAIRLEPLSIGDLNPGITFVYKPAKGRVKPILMKYERTEGTDSKTKPASDVARGGKSTIAIPQLTVDATEPPVAKTRKPKPPANASNRVESGPLLASSAEGLLSAQNSAKSSPRQLKNLETMQPCSVHYETALELYLAEYTDTDGTLKRNQVRLAPSQSVPTSPTCVRMEYDRLRERPLTPESLTVRDAEMRSDFAKASRSSSKHTFRAGTPQVKKKSYKTWSSSLPAINTDAPLLKGNVAH